MTYKELLTEAMTRLGSHSNTIFLGQSVNYPGQAMFSTLCGVPVGKRLELPIMEECQMGISIGLSLQGYLPISLFTRMNFLILAMNQLVNHLDKIAVLSHGEFTPKVIIRTMVGSKHPLDGGIQHTEDFSQDLEGMIPHLMVYRLTSSDVVLPFYEQAYHGQDSCVMVEYESLYG